MSERFILTDEAAANAADLWEHLAQEQDEDVADRFLAQIHDACQRLADMPGIGHYREELLDHAFRFWAAGSILIVYRWETRPLQIVAIVHGARNLQRLFTDRPSE